MLKPQRATTAHFDSMNEFSGSVDRLNYSALHIYQLAIKTSKATFGFTLDNSAETQVGVTFPAKAPLPPHTSN